MRTLKVCAVLAGLLSALTGAQAWAGPKRPTTPAEPRPIHLEMEDEVVPGGTLKPDGTGVIVVGPRGSESLIRFRQTFIPELVKASESL